MEQFERLILEKIKTRTGKILYLPIDIWINLIDYSAYIQDFETCVLLMNLIDIVALETFQEFIEKDDREWYQKQNNLNL